MGSLVSILGPPLSGKSTLSRRLCQATGASYFSVRNHFERLRARGEVRLPPVGTLLSDETVWSAVEPMVMDVATGGCMVLDGFPATAGQAHALRSLVGDEADLSVFVLSVRRSEARRRALKRRVCMACDGGVDDARRATDATVCPSCGAALTRRPDDDDASFRQRWIAYADRLPATLAALRASGNAAIEAAIHLSPVANALRPS